MLSSKTLTATALGLFGALLFSAKAIVVKLAYLDGHKELLGMWAEENEGAKLWMKVLTRIQNR